MSLLDYLGSSLEKPGRAVRGLLAGRPQEAMAALPFSDSMGLTNPEDRVSGHDLLSMLGAEPGDGIGGTLAGIGADVATDPLTYLGGYLAKRLLGGGFRPVQKGMQEGETFDLVQPWERNTGHLSIPTAEPVPSQYRFEPPAPRPTETIPELNIPPFEMPPDPFGALPEMLPTQHYGMLTGHSRHGMYSPSLYGIPSDAVAEGRRMDALGVQLHGWDQVMADIERLAPEEYARITGRAKPPSLADAGPPTRYDPFGGGRVPLDPGEIPLPESRHWSDPQLSVTGENWQHSMGAHAADLAGMLRDMPGAFPAAGAIRPQLEGHLRRLEPLLRSEATIHDLDSPARAVLRDIGRGEVRPREVASLEDVLSHLPFDSTALRREAAVGQQRALLRQIEEDISVLTEGEIPVGHLADHYQHDFLADRLGRALDPKRLGNMGYEPGIIGQVLNRPQSLHPSLQPEAELAQQVSALLTRLLASHG